MFHNYVTFCNILEINSAAGRKQRKNKRATEINMAVVFLGLLVFHINF